MADWVKWLNRYDLLRTRVEELADWYLEKDANHPGSVTASLDIANDLQSLLHDFTETEDTNE